MNAKIARAAAVTAFVLGLAAPAVAQDAYAGYLCCNLRTEGSCISDSNYAENGKKIIPFGTPTKMTGYGRQRVQIEVNGGRQAIGNDYSRDLDLPTFAKRYVVTEDPKAKLASAPPKIRQAVESARLVPGMTREQVLMSVGYPI